MEVTFEEHKLPGTAGDRLPKAVLMPLMMNTRELEQGDRLFRLQPTTTPLGPPRQEAEEGLGAAR